MRKWIVLIGWVLLVMPPQTPPPLSAGRPASPSSPERAVVYQTEAACLKMLRIQLGVRTPRMDWPQSGRWYMYGHPGAAAGLFNKGCWPADAGIEQGG